MTYTVTLNDLKTVDRVYYIEDGAEIYIPPLDESSELPPIYYEVDSNTNTVTVTSEEQIPTPKIDYVSTDPVGEVVLNLGTIGAVDINGVVDGENNNLEYTINNDNTITVQNVQAGESISIDYDLERIRIGALEYEDGDKTKNPTKYGMRIRNSQGEDVLTTDDNGDITMTGTIHAYAGYFTGTVNAQAGEFSGNVRVGSSDSYVALTTELEDGPAIASSDYVRDRNRGWAITGDGNAIFNNITARGSIKTAVFEYQEIDAVGGAFLFRPSSTVRTASVDAMRHYITVDGAVEIDLSEYYPVKIEKVIVNGTEDTAATFDYDSMVLTPSLIGTTEITYITADLWITVEKPAQFYDQEWVKLGVDPDGSAREMIAGAGLTAVYKLEKYIDPDMYTESGYIDESSEIEPQFILRRAGNDYYTEDMIIDEDESSLIFSDDSSELVYELEGTALISFGYEDGSDNYGIGINSGAADLILPPRAISLFESRIEPKENVKVGFDYTGILGTLPEIKDGVLPLDVDEDIYKNMGGTQGIYTNNMYIGDANQYVAFYEESNEKVLDIAAGSISVGMGNYDPLYLIGDQYGVALYRGEKADSTQDIESNNLFIDDESLSLRNGQTPIFKAKEEEIKYKDYSYTYDISYGNNQEIDLTNWDYTSQTYSGQKLLDGVVTQNGTYNLFIDIYPFMYYENIHFIGYLTLTKDVEYYIYQADPEHYSEPIITSEKIEGSEYTVGCGIKYIKNENKLIIYNLNYYPSYSVLKYSEATISSKIIEQNASLSLGTNHEFLKGGVAIGYNNKILDENGVAIGSNLLVKNNQIVLGNFNTEDDSVVKEYNLDLSAITTIPQVTINNIILYNVCFRSVDISDIVLDEEQNLKVGNLTFVLGDGPEQSNYEYYTLPISLNAAKIIDYEDSYQWKWALEFHYTNSKYKATIYYNPSYISDNWFLEKIYYNNNYIFSIGNGYNNSFRSNALAVDIFGNLTIGRNLIMGDNEFYVNSDHGGRFVLGKEDTYHSNYINYSTEGEYLNNISFSNDGRFTFNRVPWSDAIMDHDWSQSTAVWNVDMTDVAPLTSPTFTGIPAVSGTVPASSTSTTQIATTAFVQNAINRRLPKSAVYLASGTTSVATSTNVYVNVYTPTVTGFIIGYAYVSFPVNATGQRRIDFVHSTSNTSCNNMIKVSASSGGVTGLVAPIVWRLSANEVLKIMLWQNSGSTLSVTRYFYGMFIPD